MPDPVDGVTLGDIVVVLHAHEVEARQYRLVIGQQYLSGEEVVHVEVIRDYLFADDDPRWFDDSGQRLGVEETAQEQRLIIRAVLAEDAANAAKSTSLKLPGSGELL
jgi:hypothetical protein